MSEQKLSKKELNKLAKKEKKPAPVDDGRTPVYTVNFSKDQSANPDLTRALDVFLGQKLAKLRYQHAPADVRKAAPQLTAISGSPAGAVSGDAAIARFLARSTEETRAAVLGGNCDWVAAQIDSWLEVYNGVVSSSSFAAGLPALLEKALETRTFLVADNFTLADIAAYVALAKAKITPAEGSNVARWAALIATFVPEAPAQIPVYFPPPVKAAKPVVAGKKEETNEDDGGSCPPLENAIQGQVVTRFPPEPSGYMHIGHCKAVMLNLYYAERYEGRLIIRFDDTNPSKEKDEYEENILADLVTLGVPTGTVTHSSDYFKECEDYGRQMIKAGNAYMDNTDQETMQAERMERKESRNRNLSVEENLALFESLLRGDAETQKYCLRAKIDMTSVNGTMRDPVLYRFNDTPHHRTGTTFKAYPTYDFACPIIDAIEGVTHALRTTEYNDRDEQYHWIQNALGLRHVYIQTYGKLNFVNTVLSKRKLNWFVENNIVEGWFDPRFPTIQGCIRRGMNVGALKSFIISQGASRRVITMEWDKFWAKNKSVLEETAPRLMGVHKEGSVVLTIENVAAENTSHTVQIHPQKPELGDRIMRRFNKVLLDQIDAATYTVGEDVTLLRWGNVKITDITKDESGNVTALKGLYDAEATNFSKTKKATWLAETPETVAVELVEFDHLITKAKLAEDENFQNFVNYDSKKSAPGIVDGHIRTLKAGDVIQLERKGFYRIDEVATADKPAVLFYIPDGKVKKEAKK